MWKVTERKGEKEKLEGKFNICSEEEKSFSRRKF